MRFLLIDQITAYEPENLIKGVKNITMSEDFLEFHFPKNPVMPGVLLLEALTQLAGWLEASGSDFQNWLLVNRVQKCRFYGFALPGDQVELEVRLLSSEEGKERAYTGTGLVKGKKKITAQFRGDIVPLSTLEDVQDQRDLFHILTRQIAPT